jgi:hypothetical protein
MTGSGNGNGNGAAALSDDLIARAKAIATRSDELLSLLEDAQNRLVDPADQPATQRRVDPARRSKASAKSSGVPEALRVLTFQMSVSGASRDEIAKRLRDEFGVRDPEAILKSMSL